MKTLLAISLLTFSLISVGSCQNVAQTVKSFWWDVQQGCFTGTSVTKRNGMFMSTASKIPVGSTYILKKGLFGKVKGASLDFTHKTILENLTSFPSKVESASATPPCPFELEDDLEYQLEIAGKLIDQSNIGTISTNIQNALKRATTLKLDITKWGFDIIEQGEIELCLDNNENSRFVRKLRNGKRYISLTAIWVEGINLSHKLDQQTLTTIKAFYESNEETFKNAGITFTFESTTNFTTDFNYSERFYPFYRFGKITKKGEVEGITEEIIVEPDFTEINNL